MRRRWGLCSIAALLFAGPLSAGNTTGNMVFVPLAPCRVIDSSIAGGSFAAGETRSYTLRGPTADYSASGLNYGGSASGCGIPGFTPLGFDQQNLALALALNVTAKNAAGKGNFQAFPSNQAAGTFSTLNFNGVVTQPVNDGMNIANGVVVPICDETGPAPCASGDLSVKASFGSAFLVVDVVGYFTEGGTRGGSRNLALGHQALATNTTGFSNVAIGHETLHNNSSGATNTASGAYALYSNTTGSGNTATGYKTLNFTTTGFGNTADGSFALLRNTTGSSNTANGELALNMNSTGARDTATGRRALQENTVGDRNTAIGYAALETNTTGSGNTAIGESAGINAVTGSDNVFVSNRGFAADTGRIRIGTSGAQTTTFIAGIRNVTTASANAVPVLIDSAGQLGTISSSVRFKEDVRDMGGESERILNLRPVTFRYKQEVRPGEQPREYGLIAEQVAEVFPELAVYGTDGKPETVKYHVLPALLLNELQRQHEQLAAQQEIMAELRRELESLRRSLESTRDHQGQGPPGE